MYIIDSDSIDIIDNVDKTKSKAATRLFEMNNAETPIIIDSSKSDD